MFGRRFKQGGFTYVELIVGLALTVVVLTAVSSLLSGLLFSARIGTGHIELQQATRVAVDTMVRELRYAKQIIYPDAATTGVVDHITFINADGETVTFSLGTTAGANLHTLYRTRGGVDNPVSENNVSLLEFTVERPRLITVRIQATDQQGGVAEFTTAVTCLNIPE